MQLHFRFLAHWLLLSLEWFASGFWRYQLNNWWIYGQFLKLWWLWRRAHLELLPLVNFRHLGKMKAAQKNFEQYIELRKLARLQLSFFPKCWGKSTVGSRPHLQNYLHPQHGLLPCKGSPFLKCVAPPPLSNRHIWACKNEFNILKPLPWHHFKLHSVNFVCQKHKGSFGYSTTRSSKDESNNHLRSIDRFRSMII